MRYLITTPEHPPFRTEFFDPENHFTPGMVVYDLLKNAHTTDGQNWLTIEIDTL